MICAGKVIQAKSTRACPTHVDYVVLCDQIAQQISRVAFYCRMRLLKMLALASYTGSSF